jgi:asparagine synthase (glutamine-hydrolysing)
MCGIVGILCVNEREKPSQEFLNSATQSLVHRGPDNQGIWSSGQIGFGHRRLSIIDLEGGVQPMHDATGRYTITYNGEIYNYRDLRRFLKAKNYVFHTESDTEVILNSYAHWGSACVEHFNGIFAFGLWDAYEHTLFLARDHLGVKPLFYFAGTRHLVFASELKALLQYRPLETRIDVFALSDYLSLGYILAPKTIYRDVKKLQPASWLVWKADSYRIQRFWDLAGVANQISPAPMSAKKVKNELNPELDRAVRDQLVSDVPLGAFLSGGVDSSTIVQKTLSAGSGQLKTFSIGFGENSYSELPYARQVADYLGTEHYEETISPNLEVLLPQLVKQFDEPFSDTSALPTYLLCQLARQHVKVALSGDGGDECFGGYETYIADKLQGVYGRLPFMIHQKVIAPLVARIPSSHRKVSWDFKLKQFIKYARSSPELAHYSWRLIFSEAEKKTLFGGGGLKELGDYNPFETFLDYYREVPNGNALNRSLYVDIKTWLADDILVKVDRTSMAWGLEARVPLLDHKLVELAMSIPSNLKVKGFQTKYILKEVMAPFLPKTIVHRAKRGFNAPVASWVANYSHRMSRKNCEPLSGQPALWEKLIHNHRAHLDDNGFKLWTLLNWSLWNNSFQGVSSTRVL